VAAEARPHEPHVLADQHTIGTLSMLAERLKCKPAEFRRHQTGISEGVEELIKYRPGIENPPPLPRCMPLDIRQMVRTKRQS